MSSICFRNSNYLPSCLSYRAYSTDSLDDKLIIFKGQPLKILYVNTLENKAKIVKENKDKSGVYMWIHTESNKIYIGSSINIGRRFAGYFSKFNLSKNKTMTICKALLKYGHSQFSFAILEYCDASNRIERENYYINLLEPKYNVLNVAGLPPTGLKSGDVKQNMSLANSYAYKVLIKDTMENNKSLMFPSLKSASLHLGVDIHIINKYLKNLAINNEGVTALLLERYTLEILGEPKNVISISEELSKPLWVTDVISGNISNKYSSINAFAYAIDAHPNNVRTFISRMKNSNKLSFYRGRYMLELINDESFIPLILPIEIEVTDLETGITKGYCTASVVAKALGINRKLILNNLSSPGIEKNPISVGAKKYTLKLVGDSVVKPVKLNPTSSKNILVTNIETNEVFKFYSANEASRSLGLSLSGISRYLNGISTRPIKSKYIIKREEDKG